MSEISTDIAESDEEREMLRDTSGEGYIQEVRSVSDSSGDINLYSPSNFDIMTTSRSMNNELQEIHEIKIMVLWTRQAICNIAKGKGVCDVSDSENVRIMKDLITLAVQETVCTSPFWNVIYMTLMDFHYLEYSLCCQQG